MIIAELFQLSLRSLSQDCSESGLLGKLKRSKVTGPDKKLNFRLLLIHSSAYVHQKFWMLTGWQLLEKGAPYFHDYLPPAPSNNYRGFKNKELSYRVAFAVQTRILAFATYRGQKIFRTSSRHYFTPNNALNFMPTATAVLNFSRSDRDMLGGWSAEGSERYSRAAKIKITSMQQAVSATFRSAELDPLAEGDDIDLLGQFLKSWNVQDDEILRTKRLLVSRTFTDVQREDPSETTGTDVILLAGDLLPDDTLDEDAALKKKLSREKQQSWNRGRSVVLGDDHKKARIAIRAELEPVCYTYSSGKKRIKVLHRLGQCYMLPGVDYVTYDFVGNSFPAPALYDTVCKWCAKSQNFKDAVDSSGTNTSLSSEEER